MSTVLLIGGTGSIGRLVTVRVSELGDTARVLTRRPQFVAASTDLQVVAGDLADRSALLAALDGADAVVMTHGAPYGSGDYEAVDYGAVPSVLEALDGERELHVVLMSSIGVTGAGGSSRDLLDWKRRGERLLRSSGLPYTIVRPGWFDAGTGEEPRADLRQGDAAEYGPVRREHVAEVLAQAIHAPSASGRTLEVFSTDGPHVSDWTAAFGELDPDRRDSLDGVRDVGGLLLDREPARVLADLDRFRRPN